MESSTTAIIIFGSALFVATPYTLISKALLDMKGVGLSGEIESFSYPLFQTFGMFVGMTGALLLHAAVVNFRLPFPGYFHKTSNRNNYTPLVTRHPNKSASIRKTKTPIYYYFILFIPSAFDMITMFLCTSGLQYIDASMFQMLRGSTIIYVAILKQFVLGHRLRNYQWVGVMWNVIAVIILGLVAYLGSSSNPTTSTPSPTEPAANIDDTALGILLILSGAFVQSLQIVFEELVLHLDHPISPLILIGMEGFWGIVICVFILYPIASYLPGKDHGCAESYRNTWTIFINTPAIQLMFLGYLFCVFWYNILAVLVTLLLDSIWRSMLDNFRPITVWALALTIHYCVSSHYFEAWSGYSKFQVIGLLLLLYGSAIYSAPNPGSIKLTGGWTSFFLDFTDEYPVLYIPTTYSETGLLKPAASSTNKGVPTLSGRAMAGTDGQLSESDDKQAEEVEFKPLVKTGSIINGRYGQIIKGTPKHHNHFQDPEANKDSSNNSNSSNSGKLSPSMKEMGVRMKRLTDWVYASVLTAHQKWRKKKIAKHVFTTESGRVTGLPSVTLIPSSSPSSGHSVSVTVTHDLPVLNVNQSPVIYQMDSCHSSDDGYRDEFHEDPALDLVLVSTEARRGGGYKMHRYSTSGVFSMEMDGNAFYVEE